MQCHGLFNISMFLLFISVNWKKFTVTCLLQRGGIRVFVLLSYIICFLIYGLGNAQDTTNQPVSPTTTISTPLSGGNTVQELTPTPPQPTSTETLPVPSVPTEPVKEITHPTEPITSTPTEIKAELTWWHFGTRTVAKEAIESLITKFQQENPGIIVKTTELNWDTGYEKILSAFREETAPDILELGSDMIGEFAGRNLLRDLTADVAKSVHKYRARNSATYQRKIYALPWLLDTRVLYYNRRLIRRAGLDQTKIPETWDDLKKYIQKINAIEPGVFGFGLNTFDRHVLFKKVLPFMWSNGGDILSTDGSKCILNSPENRQALSFILSLAPYSFLGKQKELDEMFKQGRIGFWISGSWLAAEISSTTVPIEYGVTFIPKPGKTQSAGGISYAGGEFLVLNKNTKFPKESLSFIEYLTREDNALYLCQTMGMFIPGVKVAVSPSYYETRPIEKVFAEQLEKSYTSPSSSRWMYIKDIFEEEIGEVMEGLKPVSRALRDGQYRINELLKIEK